MVYCTIFHCVVTYCIAFVQIRQIKYYKHYYTFNQVILFFFFFFFHQFTGNIYNIRNLATDWHIPSKTSKQTNPRIADLAFDLLYVSLHFCQRSLHYIHAMSHTHKTRILDIKGHRPVHWLQLIQVLFALGRLQYAGDCSWNGNAILCQLLWTETGEKSLYDSATTM